jgi:hypothetical protein
MMNLRKLLRRLFQRRGASKAKQQRHAFQEWQRTRPPSLPDVPTIDLAKQRIETKPAIPYRVGNVLAQDRAQRGLKTIRLEPLQDESWINSKLMPVIAPPTPLPQVYEIAEASILDSRLSALHQLLDTETEERPAVVKEFHEKRNKQR